jgi:hypothetical protein
MFISAYFLDNLLVDSTDGRQGAYLSIIAYIALAISVNEIG